MVECGCRILCHVLLDSWTLDIQEQQFKNQYGFRDVNQVNIALPVHTLTLTIFIFTRLGIIIIYASISQIKQIAFVLLDCARFRHL